MIIEEQVVVCVGVVDIIVVVVVAIVIVVAHFPPSNWKWRRLEKYCLYVH